MVDGEVRRRSAGGTLCLHGCRGNVILHEDFMKNGREVCEDGAGQSDRSEVSGRSDRCGVTGHKVVLGYS